jgi:hypothetical protein
MLGSATLLFAAMQITLVLGAPSSYKDIRSSDISNVERHQIRHVDGLQISKNKAAVTVTTTTIITAGMPYSSVYSIDSKVFLSGVYFKYFKW